MKQELTTHAEKRMRQRGFSGHAMDMIVHYGRYEPAPLLEHLSNYQSMASIKMQMP